MSEYEVGDLIVAKENIVEGSDNMIGDPVAEKLDKQYIHARKGDVGKVKHIDENHGLATVQFEDSATLVSDKEVEKIG